MPTNSLFDDTLSDPVLSDMVVTKEVADYLFEYFRRSSLFRWQDSNNDCEDRANAICIALDRWGIINYKAWVFSAQYLKRGTGSLVNFWNYHVAACLPVLDNNMVQFLVLDPATLHLAASIDQWAEGVTSTAFSYYLIKRGDYYIFPNNRISRDNWHKRDTQNYKWTIQGLSGINGVSKTGKAQVIFNKKRIQRVEKEFKYVCSAKPEIPGT